MSELAQHAISDGCADETKFADFTKFGKSRVQPEQSIKALILQSLGVSWSIPKKCQKKRAFNR